MRPAASSYPGAAALAGAVLLALLFAAPAGALFIDPVRTGGQPFAQGDEVDVGPASDVARVSWSGLRSLARFGGESTLGGTTPLRPYDVETEIRPRSAGPIRIVERPPFGELAGTGDGGSGPAVPEPGAALLFGAGAGAVALRLRRRRR